MEKSASAWSEWCASTWPKWGVCRREVQNSHCGGPIRCNTSLMIVAPLSVIDILGTLDEQDEVEPMGNFMDDSNLRYSDYLGGWTRCQGKQDEWQEGSPFHPVVDCEIDWKGETWAVFDTSSVAPDITNKSGSQEDYRFLVSIADAGLRRSIRPI